MTATLLLLADGRFPSGGHAHSSGLEAAVAAGRVRDVADLEAFLRGRLATAGLVAASFAAASCSGANLDLLDAELDARTASPALRLTSRRQGRALLRAAASIWPAPVLACAPVHPDGCHQPIAYGLTAAAAGLSVSDAALGAAYGVLTGPASAAVRLLGLDPYQAQAALARLAGACDAVVRAALLSAGGPPSELPACTAPLSDIHAEIHATREVRLFAS